MALSLVTPPTKEPIELDEAKLHLRVSIDEDDTLILGLISAARDYLEKATNRQFLQATWLFGVANFGALNCLKLPRPPLGSITGVTYVDSAGVTQTLAATVYGVDTLSEPGRLYLKSGQSWPSVSSVPNAVRVTYTAGYLTAAQFFQRHATLRSALLLLIAHLYEHREASVEAGVGRALSQIPLGVESLLWMNRLVEVV